jgi:hypothetical protein
VSDKSSKGRLGRAAGPDDNPEPVGLNGQLEQFDAVTSFFSTHLADLLAQARVAQAVRAPSGGQADQINAR